MLKTDFKKEIESTLDLIKTGIDKDLIEGNIEDALKKVDRGMKGILGLDIMTVNTLSFSNVIELISKENQYNSDRYMALGELLYFQGYIYGKQHDETNKINYYKKSVRSFYEAYHECKEIDERYKVDITEMLDFLSEYELELSESNILFKLYEYNRHFDKAENILFDMIKKSSKSEEVIHQGIEFYNRIKELDKEILEEGNLPLEEINDSLSEIKNMLK